MPMPVRPKPKKVFLSPFETLLSLVCLQLSILFSSSLPPFLSSSCLCAAVIWREHFATSKTNCLATSMQLPISVSFVWTPALTSAGQRHAISSVELFFYNFDYILISSVPSRPECTCTLAPDCLPTLEAHCKFDSKICEPEKTRFARTCSTRLRSEANPRREV